MLRSCSLVFLILLCWNIAIGQTHTFCIGSCGNQGNCVVGDVNSLDGMFIPGDEMNCFFGGVACILGPSQFNCPGAGPDLPAYHFFLAGSTDIVFGIDGSNCVGTFGLQLGLSASCSSECLVGKVECTGVTSQFIEYGQLIPGNTYMIWLDGCSGTYCDIDFWVEPHPPFEFDEPHAITAFSNCTNECLTNNCDGMINCTEANEIVVCPGDEVQFGIRHQGDSPTNNGIYDEECSFYNPDLEATFEWFFVDDFNSGTSYSIDPTVDGAYGPTIIIPEVTVETVTEICLEGIHNEFMETSEEACLTVIIKPIEHEVYHYEVCAEDLYNTWRAPKGEDPNKDGITWLGPSTFTLAEVEALEEGCYHSSEFINCECEVNQTICIDIQGSVHKEEKTLYMYDCQFGEEDEYLWEWTNPYEKRWLERGTSGECFVIDEHSLQKDYNEEYCDTTMLITVETYSVNGEPIMQDCSSEKMTAYGFELDLSFYNNLPRDSWTEINEDYFIEWIDCSTGEVLLSSRPDSDPRYIEVAGTRELCVKATFSFYDGVWGHPELSPIQNYVSCDKIFGPYILQNQCKALLTCPTWQEGIELSIDGVTLPNQESELVLEPGMTLGLSLKEDLLPDDGFIEWWLMDTPNEVPGQAGIIVGESQIESNWKYGEKFPELVAISYRDFENQSEYFIVESGSGLYIDDLTIALDNNCDNSCPADCVDELYGTQCAWKQSEKTVLKDCANVIPVGPGDYVPPNSFLVVYVDESEEKLIRSAENLCSIDGCIYVLFSECERCLDGFADDGPGSYTLEGNGFNSTLSYIANPDGGAVNSQGAYSYERDSLPQLATDPLDISAYVETMLLTITCPEVQGEKYLQGRIVSESYNTDCCSPYTPSVKLIVTCDEEPGETVDSVFISYPFLSNLIDTTNCNGVTITVYTSGIYNFVHIEDAFGGTLYFQDGTLYCQDAPGFSCVMAYGLGTATDSWTCNSGGGGTNPQPTLFDNYPWLASLIDPDDCAGTEVELYQFGSQLFPYVLTDDSAILYSNTGQLYCSSILPSFDCIEIYGLSAPVSTWKCDDVVQPGSPIFESYSWLNALVSQSDCDDEKITVYQSGNYTYLIVEAGGETSMYNSEGLFYCQDFNNFSCVEAYGFSASDIIGSWSCDGFRALEVRESWDVRVYPNPTTGILLLDSELELDELNVELYDLNGRRQSIVSDNKSSIDLSVLPTGIYLLKLQVQGYTELKRIIKI